MNIWHLAAIYDDVVAVQHFCEHGLRERIWDKTTEGRNITHFAAKHGTERVLRYLHSIAMGQAGE